MAKTYVGHTLTEGNADLDPLWTIATGAAAQAATATTSAASAAAAAAGAQTTANTADAAAIAAQSTATAAAAALAALPLATKYTQDASAGPYVALAGELTGAVLVYADFTGISASTLTTRTAAQMIADATLAIGQAYTLRLINGSGGTCTLTAGGGVTLIGPVAILTATFVDYIVTVTGAGAMTFQSVGSGVVP